MAEKGSPESCDRMGWGGEGREKVREGEEEREGDRDVAVCGVKGWDERTVEMCECRNGICNLNVVAVVIGCY